MEAKLHIYDLMLAGYILNKPRGDDVSNQLTN